MLAVALRRVPFGQGGGKPPSKLVYGFNHEALQDNCVAFVNASTAIAVATL